MKADETGTVGVVVHGTMRRKRRRGLMRYLALYVIIVCGVAWGILLAKWITGSREEAPGASFAQKAGDVASEVGSDLHAVYRQAVATVTGQEGTEDEGLRESRAASAKGRELANRCENWRLACEERHSEEALAEMNKSCRRYEAFLATGDSLP